MKLILNLLVASAAITGLASCTTPQTAQQLSQTSVNYQCGPGGQNPLTVQYTFQGGEALSARVIYQNQVVELPRSMASNADMVGNTFRSENYTWVTDKFTYDTVGNARGEMLTRELARTHTGTIPSETPSDEVSNIIVRDCVPVSATSA